MTLTLKRSKSAILCDPQTFDPNFLKTVRDREKVSIEVREDVVYGLSNIKKNSPSGDL